MIDWIDKVPVVRDYKASEKPEYFGTNGWDATDGYHGIPARETWCDQDKLPWLPYKHGPKEETEMPEGSEHFGTWLTIYSILARRSTYSCLLSYAALRAGLLYCSSIW